MNGFGRYGVILSLVMNFPLQYSNQQPHGPHQGHGDGKAQGVVGVIAEGGQGWVALALSFALSQALACSGNRDVGPMKATPPIQPQVTPAPVGGSFKLVGRLLQARQGLAAAPLADGRILVMGGSATLGGTGWASSEIYSPATGHSSPGFAMNHARSNPAAARLGNGQVLVLGGADATSVDNSSELYDPFSGLFTPAGSMTRARSRPTATPLIAPPGVLIAGGLPGEASILERFDQATTTFLPAGSLPLAPGHSATPLPNGKILLVSHSEATDGTWQPFAALYDPGNGSVRATAGQPSSSREGHQALLLVNPPMVLILGGRNRSGPLANAEWYEPANDRFLPCPNSMLSPRTEFGAAVLANGHVLLLGGTVDGVTACTSAERFDPVTKVFAPTGSLNLPRRQPCVLPLSSGPVLVLGGSNETRGCLAEVEAYCLPGQKSPLESPEPAPRSWKPLP